MNFKKSLQKKLTYRDLRLYGTGFVTGLEVCRLVAVVSLCVARGGVGRTFTDNSHLSEPI